VNASRIVFSRTRAADGLTAAVMLFDATSGVMTELDPRPAVMRFGAVVGGDTVAFTEFAFGGADIFVYDLAAGIARNVTSSSDLDMNPALSPGGDVKCVCCSCIAQSGRRCGCWWGAGLISLSPPRSGGQGRWEFAPVAHLLKDRQAARGSVAPLGAKGSPRLSMCQIASDSRRVRSIWPTLAPRCLPTRGFVFW